MHDLIISLLLSICLTSRDKNSSNAELRPVNTPHRKICDGGQLLATRVRSELVVTGN